MPQAQVKTVLNDANSTLPELLNAHEDICIQYGYLSAVSGFGLRENVEPDLLEIICLMTLIKERIKRTPNLIN